MKEPTYEEYLRCTPKAWQFFLDAINSEKQRLEECEQEAQFWAEQMSEESIEKHRQDIRSMGGDPDEPPFYNAYVQDKEYADLVMRTFQEQKQMVDFMVWYKDASPEDIIRKPAEEYPTTVSVETIAIRLHDFTEEQLLEEYDKWRDFHSHCRERFSGWDFNSEEHWVWRIKETIKSYREDIFKPLVAVEETASIVEAEQERNPHLSEHEVAAMWQRSKESIDSQWNINMPLPEHIKENRESHRIINYIIDEWGETLLKIAGYSIIGILCAQCCSSIFSRHH